MSPEWRVEGLESGLTGFHLGPIDLALAPGHAVAVLGTSGAGKTTLLRTLAGFLPARHGRIYRDGTDITDWPPEERGLGYVPQGLGLLPHRTVEGNLRYPMEVRGRPDAALRASELLDRFRLRPLARRYPARLSGGSSSGSRSPGPSPRTRVSSSSTSLGRGSMSSPGTSSPRSSTSSGPPNGCRWS